MSKQLNKKLLFIRVAASAPDTVKTFYEKFFGISFAEALGNQQTFQAPIDENGIDMTIGPKNSPQDSVVPYYAVDDIKTAISDATAAGAKLVWGPEALPIAQSDRDAYKAHVQKFYPNDAKAATGWDNVGQGAIVTDPGGNPVGLVQLAHHAMGHFNAGPNKRAISEARVSEHQDSISLGLKHRAAHH